MSHEQYKIVRWKKEPAHLLNVTESTVVTLCGLMIPDDIINDWTGEIVICTRCAGQRQRLDSIEGLEHKPKGPHETKS